MSSVDVKYVEERLLWLKERCDFWKTPDRVFFEHLINEAFADMQKHAK